MPLAPVEKGIGRIGANRPEAEGRRQISLSKVGPSKPPVPESVRSG
jgi:hypothetical protein